MATSNVFSGSTFFRSGMTLAATTTTSAAAPHPQLPALMGERLCASDRPLALLPVRLETRFFAQPDGSSELRVRPVTARALSLPDCT